MNKLWDNLVVNALFEEEKDVLFLWLEEAAQSQAQMNIDIEDLIRFFCEKISILENENITESGFTCFESLCYIVNEKQGKLHKTKVQKIKKQFSNDFGYPIYNSDSDDSDDAKDEFQYTTKVKPD